MLFNVQFSGANLTEAVQADGNSMEEEIRMDETEQGDAASTEGKSSVDMSNNSPTKRGRGRSQGSKKLKVCVTDVNLMELVSGISNGGSRQPPRGRGRPKLTATKHIEQQGSGDDHADNSVQTSSCPGRQKGSEKQDSNEDSPMTDQFCKKRGRPKKSLSTSSPEKADGDLPNGGSDTPKAGRGRPKGSVKRKLETSGEEGESSSVTPKKRGRPKGSLNKKTMLEREVSSEGEAEADGSLNSLKRGRGRLRKVVVNNSRELAQNTSNGMSKTPHRGRGRPRKSIVQESGDQQDGSQPAKRGRGRLKGFLNKARHSKVGRPRRVHVPSRKRGRPRKQPAKRGRPRKYPLPSAEELKKPRVWKPLGRPRKFPRVDPPEGASPTPRKSESKKGAHLRKSLPTTPSTPRTPNDGSQRKRGRPPGTTKSVKSARSEDETPWKRGRPKGSVNKNKDRSETQLDSALPNDSKAKSNSSAVEEEHEGEHEGEPERTEVEQDAEEMAVNHRDDMEGTPIDQEASFEVSNQA